ncbi:MAG: hypothetical protein AAF921_23920 [Cyanobacteria bacterium P01_D01_bin.44]
MPETLKIILGTLITFGLHAVFWTFAALMMSALPYNATTSTLSNTVFWSMLTIGLSQLIYMVPLILWFRKTRSYGWMKGFIVGTVITALINGGCWLLFSSSL